MRRAFTYLQHDPPQPNRTYPTLYPCPGLCCSTCRQDRLQTIPLPTCHLLLLLLLVPIHLFQPSDIITVLCCSCWTYLVGLFFICRLVLLLPKIVGFVGPFTMPSSQLLLQHTVPVITTSSLPPIQMEFTQVGRLGSGRQSETWRERRFVCSLFPKRQVERCGNNYPMPWSVRLRRGWGMTSPFGVLITIPQPGTNIWWRWHMTSWHLALFSRGGGISLWQPVAAVHRISFCSIYCFAALFETFCILLY